MENFLDIWQYMPHGMCLLWQPWLVLLWSGSDALIFLSYMAIPLALLLVIRGRNDLRHRGLILLFAGFILLCGLTHLLGVITLWWPIYPYVGLVKLATGLVSATTAIVLFRLVPTLIAIPAQSQLEEINRRLTLKIAEHEAAEAELRAIRDGLEEQVSQRTEELKQANAKLAVVAREAVHRSKNLLTVVSSIARQSARGQSDINEYVTTLIGRLDALAGATETVIGRHEAASADLRLVVENQIRPLQMTSGERISIDGPSIRISSETAQQIGLAVHELATNTQKYGALAKGDGDLNVSWRKTGTGPQEELIFQWSETHAPNPGGDEPQPGGFGHALLTRVVPTMLRGTAERSNTQGRLVYELRIPAATLTTDETTKGDANMAARIVDADFGLS